VVAGRPARSGDPDRALAAATHTEHEPSTASTEPGEADQHLNKLNFNTISSPPRDRPGRLRPVSGASGAASDPSKSRKSTITDLITRRHIPSIVPS
jgi:hypothetical protein